MLFHSLKKALTSTELDPVMRSEIQLFQVRRMITDNLEEMILKLEQLREQMDQLNGMMNDFYNDLQQ